MILLAVSEFFRNLKRNLLLVVMTTAMALVLTFVMSVVIFEYEKYEPFSRFQGESGFYYCGENDYTEDCIKKKYYYYYTTAFKALTQGEPGINVFSLPEWMWSCWNPRIKDGTVFPSTIDKDADNIPLIVGGSMAQMYYNVGDIFSLYVGKNQSATFEVIGILVDKTTVIASKNEYNSSRVDYNLYYSIPYDDYFFVVQNEYLEARDIDTYVGNSKIITLKDNTNENAQRLRERINLEQGGTVNDISVFNESNNQILFQKLLTYLPIVAVGLTLVIICSYAAIYVNLAHNARHYSIFYLLGADERQRIFVCMGNGVIVTLLSVVLLIFLYYLAMLCGINENVILMTDWRTVIVLAVYYLLYMMTIGAISFFSMKGKAPGEVLREKQ